MGLIIRMARNRIMDFIPCMATTHLSTQPRLGFHLSYGSQWGNGFHLCSGLYIRDGFHSFIDSHWQIGFQLGAGSQRFSGKLGFTFPLVRRQGLVFIPHMARKLLIGFIIRVAHIWLMGFRPHLACRFVSGFVGALARMM